MAKRKDWITGYENDATEDIQHDLAMSLASGEDDIPARLELQKRGATLPHSARWEKGPYKPKMGSLRYEVNPAGKAYEVTTTFNKKTETKRFFNRSDAEIYAAAFHKAHPKSLVSMGGAGRFAQLYEFAGQDPDFDYEGEMSNPRGMTKIYNRVIKIYASKAGMPHNCDAECKRHGHDYVHTFKKKACIYGLPDGSILIK